MSPRLPSVKADEVISVLKKAGFAFDHQTGSHAIYIRLDDRRRVSVPRHGAKDLKRGTLAHIILQAGLTRDEFIKLL